MTDVNKTYTIAGAAEGSYFTVSTKRVDVRYAPSFAGPTSGLSFGVFQFDVSVNATAQGVFIGILQQGVAAKTIDQTALNRLLALAGTRNAGQLLKPADKLVIKGLMSNAVAKAAIDLADRQRAATFATQIDGMILKAANYWTGQKVSGPAILTPGRSECLQLFAYLLACLNRYPADQGPFQKWLQGGTVTTKNGPAGGFHLAAPPTIAQMHTFLSSLVIWSGSQSSYGNLRSRLDPTLARIGG